MKIHQLPFHYCDKTQNILKKYFDNDDAYCFPLKDEKLPRAEHGPLTDYYYNAEYLIISDKLIAILSINGQDPAKTAYKIYSVSRSCVVSIQETSGISGEGIVSHSLLMRLSIELKGSKDILITMNEANKETFVRFAEQVSSPLLRRE